AELAVGLLAVAQPGEEQAAGAAHVRIVGILLQREVESCLRDSQLVAAHVCNAELRIVDGGIVTLLQLLLIRAARQTQGEQRGNRGAEAGTSGARPHPCASPFGPPAGVKNRSRRFFHACTATPNTRLPSRTVVRSMTLPASWPHAASMSSPRVRRTVASTPRRISSSRKRCTASGAERP